MVASASQEFQLMTKSFFLSGLFVFAIPCQGGDDVPTLEVIKAGYAESLSLIRTIQCRYEIERERTDNPNDTSVSYFDVEYRTDGTRFATLASLGRPGDATTSRVWHAFDGKTHSKWNEITPANSTAPYFAPSGKKSADGMRGLILPVSLNTMLGKRFWGEQGRLADVFDSCKAPLITHDKLGDNDCLRVDFPAHSGSLTQPDRPIKYHTLAWFDPAVGYMPRRIRSEYEHESNVSYFDCHVELFRIFNDASGRKIFFPEGALYTRGFNDDQQRFVEYRLTIRELEINKPISDSAFVPTFPDGTKVIDLTREDRKPVAQIVGPPQLRKQLEERAIQAGERFAAQKDAIHKGQAASFPWWCIWGAALFVTLCVCAWILRRTLWPRY